MNYNTYKQKNFFIKIIFIINIFYLLFFPNILAKDNFNKSKFNEDVWIYIERKQTQSRLKNLGQMKIYKNDVLVLEIDKYGLLKKKSFYDLNDMNNIKIASEKTESGLLKNRFIYDFMSSMRQKVNDPLGQRAKKRKEAKQR